MPSQFDPIAHGIDDAWKLDQQPVAGGFDDAAAMISDFRSDEGASYRLQRRERALLVLALQPQVPGDIGHQDRRQPALDARSRLEFMAAAPFQLQPYNKLDLG
jgi:hypothetical protein